jgi:hypothetical protein
MGTNNVILILGRLYSGISIGVKLHAESVFDYNNIVASIGKGEYIGHTLLPQVMIYTTKCLQP